METRNSTVLCDNCGNEFSVSFAECMADGWPRCCGYTMRLVSHPSIEGVAVAVDEALEAQGQRMGLGYLQKELE